MRIGSILENQSVEKGAKLIKLENSSLKLQTDLSKLQLKLSEKKLFEAKELRNDIIKKLNYEKKLFKQGTSSFQKIDNFKLQLIKANIALESAEIQVTISQKELELRTQTLKDSFILSPIKGIITNINAEESEMVNANLVLIKIIDINMIRVNCNISEDQIRLIKIGSSVNFEVPAYRNKLFFGKIEKLAWISNTQTRNFNFSILSKNSKKLLRVGMTSKMNISTKQQNYFGVSAKSIRSDSGKNFVYLFSNNRITKREVFIKGSSNGYIKITGKLKKSYLK